MRWALNNEIEDLSNKVSNLLKNEKYGVCQNIKTFFTGVERCTNSDVAKRESCLSKINSALNIASDKQASIDSKRKELFSADCTLKSYTSDELAYLEKAKTKITALHEELQSASSKLSDNST